jgi:hypothetical protein
MWRVGKAGLEPAAAHRSPRGRRPLAVPEDGQFQDVPRTFRSEHLNL